MSDRRYTAILGAALLTAGAATLSAYHMLREASTPRREPTQTVVVLARDVPVGAPIPREALTSVPWPSRVAPADVFSTIDSVAGRVARVALTQGEPVRTTRLAPRGAAPGLEGTITPDHRAIAVRVSEAAGVSGLLRPNSRVDVLVTSSAPSTEAPPQARLVMADVRVLGVGPARPAEGTSGDPPAPDAAGLPANLASIVTLEVTPAQAAQLAGAEAQGAVQVVLRGFGSTGGVEAALSPSMTVAPQSTVAAGTGAATTMRVATTARARRSHPARRSEPAARVSSHQEVTSTVVSSTRPAVAVGSDSAIVRVYRNGQLSVLRVEPGMIVP